ncbi:hypothetical protein CRE_07753 [Caenorhabditis remanei]|uniref:Uncharacterized protein n=1 Tax=Caenorhabditis remanei TaxID=31234 RepID=E3N6R9_CAERE|nr:hypothetical protein CRE_07753 [Caenorhabditis remanei]
MSTHLSAFLLSRHLSCPRFCIFFFCITGIILDLFFKYNPNLPWTHLLTGTSPSFELFVIGGLLMNSPAGNRFALIVCKLDVILGVLCLLTLPVISVAENTTGYYLHMPFVSSFHSSFAFQVTSTMEFFYVALILGFVSTILILLFLAFDTAKLLLLRKLVSHDMAVAQKLKQVQQV